MADKEKETKPKEAKPKQEKEQAKPKQEKDQKPKQEKDQKPKQEKDQKPKEEKDQKPRQEKKDNKEQKPRQEKKADAAPKGEKSAENVADASNTAEDGAAAAPKKPRRERKEGDQQDTGESWKEKRDREIAEIVLVPGKVYERPDKTQHEAALKKIDDKIANLKTKIADLNSKLDKTQEDKEKRAENDPLKAEKEKHASLRSAFQAIAKERKDLFDQMKKLTKIRDDARAAADKVQDSMNENKVKTVEEVDQKIRKLEYSISTSSMSVSKEKSVIAEIKSLNAFKKTASEFDAIKARRAESELAVKELGKKLDENKIRLDEAKKAEDAVYAVINAKQSQDFEQRSKTKTMVEERNSLRESMNKLYEDRRALQAKFHNEENHFFAYDKVVKKEEWERTKREREEQKLQRQKEYEERQERRRQEEKQRKEEQRKKRLEDAEEAINYEFGEKFADLEQVIAYLKRLVKASNKKEEKSTEDVAATEEPAKEGEKKAEEKKDEKKAEKKEKKEDQPKMIQIGKNVAGFDDDVFGTKIVKPKKQQKPKPKKAAGTFSHNMHVIATLEKLGVSVPNTEEDVVAALNELQGRRTQLEAEKAEKHRKRLEELAKFEAELAARAQQEAQDKESKAAGQADADASTDAAPADDATSTPVEAN